MAIFVLIIAPNITFAEKPDAVIAPLSLFGTKRQAEEKILYNRFEKVLSNYYRLLSKAQFKKAREVVFSTIQADQCSEIFCIRKIQETLQVKRLFFLELTEANDITQLSITLIRVDDTLLEEEICQACNIEKLYQKTGDVVRKIVIKDLGSDAVGQSDSVSTAPLNLPKEEHLQLPREETAWGQIALHSLAIGTAIASSLSAVDLARQYNDLSSTNNLLSDQAQNAKTESAYTSIRRSFIENQEEMSSLKDRILIQDTLTIAAIVWEIYLLFSSGQLVNQDNTLMNQSSYIDQHFKPVVFNNLQCPRIGFEFNQQW